MQRQLYESLILSGEIFVGCKHKADVEVSIVRKKCSRQVAEVDVADAAWCLFGFSPDQARINKMAVCREIGAGQRRLRNMCIFMSEPRKRRGLGGGVENMVGSKLERSTSGLKIEKEGEI